MLLSIIVPVYNKAEYIRESVESILKQTITDFEIILINDGSIDESGSICDQLAGTDPRILVLHQNNMGVSAARNAGIRMARGQYIGFVDCDDTLEEDMYELLINTAELQKADVAICGVKKIFSDKTEAYFGTGRTYIYEGVEAAKGLLKKQFPRSVYDKIYKSSLAKSVEFTGQIYEDVLYNFLIFAKAGKTVFVDVLKYNYIIRDNSVSMSKFSSKYLDAIYVSKSIVAFSRENAPELVDEATNFDFVTHISLLNIILFSEKNKFLTEYDLIAASLKHYPWYPSRKVIENRHKYAYFMFKFHPGLYETMMRLYAKMTGADVSKKK